MEEGAYIGLVSTSGFSRDLIAADESLSSIPRVNLIELLFDMIRRFIRLPFIFVLLAPFALLAPVYATGKALFWGTPILQFVPWWVSSWRTIRSGELPLWNAQLGMGAPLIANYQSGLFYPPNWSYFLLAQIGGEPLLAWGQAVLVAAHLAWAGLGMALLVRRLGLSVLSQTISGLAFGMSGYLVARSGFLSINSAAAWLPWVILGVTNFIRNEQVDALWKAGRLAGRQKELILLSVVFGLQLLSGHAQTSWYTLLLAGLWGAFRQNGRLRNLAHRHTERAAGFQIEAEQRDMDGIKGGKPYGRASSSYDHELITGAHFEYADKDHSQELDYNPGSARSRSDQNRDQNLPVRIWSAFAQLTGIWVGIGLAALLAIALASIQLLPTAEYLLQSQRASEVDYELGMTYSFWPWRLITLIAPDMFGNPVRGDYWGYANYWEDAIYSGLIPFLLAVGALIRGIRKKHVSKDHAGLIRFLLILIIVSFLLALGSNTPIFPWLYRHVPTFDMFQAPTRFTIWAVFSLAILAGIGASYWRRPTGKGLYWTRLGTAGAVAVALGSGLAWYLLGEISPSFIRSTAMIGIWGVAAGGLTLLAPPGVPASREAEELGREHKLGKPSWWPSAVGAILCADLIVAGWGLNPGIDRGVYAGKSASGMQLRSYLEGGRLFVPEEVEYEIKFERFFRFDTFHPDEDWADLRSTLLPNTNLLDDLASVNNFDPIQNARYARWMEILNESDEQTTDRLLNLMGVQVVERVDSASPLGIEFVSREAYPRFRWVPCGHPVSNGDQSLEEVIGGELDLQQVVILETNRESLDPECLDVGFWNVEKASESPNSIVVQASTSSPGYLVVADQWYPGWRAQVDENEVDILRANYLFRAIQLPAGEHEVVLRYRPTSFYGGAIVSFLACVGMGLLFVKRI